MSLLLSNIADYLEDNAIGVVGTNIFIEKLPADPANAILLVSVLSPTPDLYLDTAYLDFEIWGRNQSSKTGGDVLSNAYTVLQRNHHLTLGDYYIYFIHAQGGIENYDEDTEGRKLMKQTYRAIYRDMRTVS